MCFAALRCGEKAGRDLRSPVCLKNMFNFKSIKIRKENANLKLIYPKMAKLVMARGVFKMPKLLAGCCSLKQLSALFGHQTNSVVVFLGKKKEEK